MKSQLRGIDDAVILERDCAEQGRRAERAERELAKALARIGELERLIVSATNRRTATNVLPEDAIVVQPVYSVKTNST